MTTDVASLRVDIVTAGAKEAAQQLNALTQNGAKAAQSFSDFSRRNIEANGALDRFNANSKNVEAAAARITRSVGLSAGSLRGIAIQLPDIGQQLLAGQSPFMIMVQQGGQVLQVLQMQEGGLKNVAARIIETITPMRALGGASAIVGAAGVAAALSWRAFALQLDDTARQAGMASGEISKMQALASFKGIGNSDFAEAMGRFSQNVYQAQNNMGGLASVFRANGIVAKDFNGSLERAADLIKNATTDQQRLVLLQQMGLPATMQWVRLLSQGADGIRRGKDAAVEFGGAVNDSMVLKAREFDEGWNKAWTNFGLSAKSGVVTAVNAFTRLNDQLERSGINTVIRTMLPLALLARGLGMPKPSEPESSGPLKVTVNKGGPAPVDYEAVRRQLSQEQTRIGVLGQLASVNDKVRATEISVRLARLDGINITKGERSALEFLTRTQEEGARLQEKITAGIGSEYQIRQQLNRELQVLIERKLLDPNNAIQMGQAYEVMTKRLEQMRDQAELARAPFEQLKRLQQDSTNLRLGLDTTAVNSLNTLTDSLVDITSGSKSAADAFKDMTNSILRDVLRLTIRASVTGPLAGALQGVLGNFAGGNAGNFGGSPATNPNLVPIGHMGGIGRELLAGFRNIHPAYFDDAPHFHQGKIPWGANEMPAIIRPEEGVFTPGQMQALGRSPVTVNHVIHNYSGLNVTSNKSQQGDEVTIETIIPSLEDALSGRVAKGRGSLAKTSRAIPSGRNLRG